MGTQLAQKAEFLKIVESGQSAETVADRIELYLPAIAKTAAATEEARMTLPESVEMMRKAGIFRSFVPKLYGGDEGSVIDFCRAIRKIAAVCPSTAWVGGVTSVHSVVVSHFSKRAQDEYWASGADTISSSSGAPSVRAIPVEGGLKVSGRFRWSSGCDHASWAMIGLKVPDPSHRGFGTRRFTDYMALVPRSDYTIDDTWYSTGMRGSGSKDLILKDVFIPDYRVERFEAMMFGFARGDGLHDSWIVNVPYGPMMGIFLPAVALGTADGMIAEFSKRQKSRKHAYSGALGILSVPKYMKLAESVHELEATTAYFEQQLQHFERLGREGKKLGEEEFIRIGARIPYVTTSVLRIVDRLFQAAGASAMANVSPMQRFWRDAHTCAMHTGSDYDVSLQLHGRAMLGLMMDPNAT